MVLAVGGLKYLPATHAKPLAEVGDAAKEGIHASQMDPELLTSQPSQQGPRMSITSLLGPLQGHGDGFDGIQPSRRFSDQIGHLSQNAPNLPLDLFRREDGPSVIALG